jgi:hypothetical protein
LRFEDKLSHAQQEDYRNRCPTELHSHFALSIMYADNFRGLPVAEKAYVRETEALCGKDLHAAVLSQRFSGRNTVS